MDSLVVVGVDVLAQQSPEVALAKHDDVADKLSANAAYEARRGSVLPWALKRCPLGSKAEPADRASNLSGEDRGVVEDEETVRELVGERVP